MRNFLVVFFILFITVKSQAQSISGPSTVTAGQTSTYTYNPGIVYGQYLFYLSNSNGSVQSSSLSGTTYTCTVLWSVSGTSTLSFSSYGTTRASLGVTINCPTLSQPNPTFSYPGTTTGCGSVTITRNGTPPTGVTWYWQSSSTGTSTANSTNTYQATTSGVHYLRANCGGTWSTAKATSSVTVKTVPTISATNPSICSGNSTNVTLTNNVASTLNTWTISNTNVTGSSTGNATSSASNPFSFAINQTLTATSNVNGTAVYTITPSVNGCTGTPYTLTATVKPIPNAAASNQNVFTGFPTSISITNPNNVSGTTFSWTTPVQTNVSGGTSGTGSTISQSLTATTSSNGTANYTITPSATGCSGTAVSAIATVYPAPVVTGSSGNVIMGAGAVLDAGPGYASYAWKKSSNPGVTLATTRTYTTNDAGTYQVTVTKSGVSGSVTSSFVVSSQFGNQNLNYIISNALQFPTTDTTRIKYLPVDSLSQSVQYYDGHGRIAQSVVTQGSPLKQDMVSVSVYDAYGRQVKNYLPFVANQNTGYHQVGLIDANGNYAGAAQNFYSNATDKIADDARPFTEAVLESSELNRPLQSFGPGQQWKDADKAVKHSYLTNVHGTSAGQERIILWTVNASGKPVRTGHYPSARLSIKSTTDENGNEVREYVNKSGQTILKKVAAVANPVLDDPAHWAQTYYVYDNYELLRFVLQPELVKNLVQSGLSPTDSELGAMAFHYKYNGKNQMIVKKVPGADSVYMVYDNRDRLVMTQDGNQRNAFKWSFTKYDQLNRTVITGIYTHSSEISQKAMTTLISSVNFFETYNGVGATHGYTNTVFPTTNTTILTASYYDTYAFKSLTTGIDYANGDLTGMPATENLATKGLATGGKINILGSTDYLYSVSYYDDRYRVIQTISQNHKSGLDRVTMKLDFMGKVQETKRTYVVGGVTRTVKESFTYDHAGRVLTVKHSTNGAADVMLVKNEYNELGQLIDKKLHSIDNGISFKQSIDFRFNIQGWLTSINNSKLNSTAINDDINDIFGMELGYNSDLGLGATPQYNGNIAAIKWSNNTIESSVLQRGYAFTYDAMSRLKDANQKEAKLFDTWISGNYDESGFNYDLNGNIKSLQRKDETGALIDNLTYDYGAGTTASNKLLYVNDAADATKGFVNGNTGTDDYTYDVNGNLIVDKNKGVTAITYNHLNLPVQVNKGASNYIRYTYDATGRKLTQQVFGSTAKTTDYVGELILENNVLQFVNQSEGRVLPDGANWEYQYHLKDHLDNVRSTFSAKQTTDDKKATLETANATTEQAEFMRYAEARKIQSYLFDRTNGSSPNVTTGYAQRLNGSEYEKYGLAKSLSVMPGDVITAEVYAKYIDQTSSNWTGALTTLLSQIAGGTAPAGTVVDGANYSGSTSSFQFPVAAGQNTANSSETGPKAYLNWLIFKRDGTFMLSQSGYDRISITPKENGQDVAHERLYSPNITITEPGFVYIYLSNEEGTPLEVYFDDFKVTHTIETPVIQTDDYYPFGLTFNSYSRENSVLNKFKFQGQEHNDDLDLEWDSFKWRNHMPDIGRFFNIDPLAEKYVYNSPYAFSENHVVAHRELEGLEKVLAIFFHGGVEGDGKQTTPEKSGGAGEIYNYTQKNAESKNLEFKGIIVAPGSDSDDGVETATNFFNENYQEGDKVVVYGYSYGGDGAVEFSKGLNEQDKPVDLLVTVDSSDGLVGLGANATVDTDVPENVGLNLNVYQNEPAGTTRANGEPNTAQNKEKTKVVNIDGSGPTTTHGNIQQKNQSIIQTVINSVINY